MQLSNYYNYFLFQDYIVPLRATSPNLGPVFIISDMGEFNSTRIREELLLPHGIVSNTTCSYVPAHNGVIERFWRTLSDATVCQLIASSLSEEFWEESARCANYIINRLVGSHPEVNSQSPYEVLLRCNTSYIALSYLRVYM